MFKIGFRVLIVSLAYVTPFQPKPSTQIGVISLLQEKQEEEYVYSFFHSFAFSHAGADVS